MKRLSRFIFTILFFCSSWSFAANSTSHSATSVAHHHTKKQNINQNKHPKVATKKTSSTKSNGHKTTSPKTTPKKDSHKIAYQQESPNLWLQITRDFKLSHEVNHPAVQKQIQWYQAHPDYLQRATDYSQHYLYYVYHEIKKRHLPAELALLPIIESAYDPFAYSWVGAAGMWQMMPKTGYDYGLNQSWWYDARKSIKPATGAALNYLTALSSFFNGNWQLAIAAYDAGQGRVQTAVNNNLSAGRKSSFWDLSLPTETENYVPKLLGLAEVLSHPQKYHMNVPFVPNKPYFIEVNPHQQLVLTKAAQLAHINVDTLYELNPGYTRFATGPNGPYELLLPVSAAKIFQENLALETALETPKLN